MTLDSLLRRAGKKINAAIKSKASKGKDKLILDADELLDDVIDEAIGRLKTDDPENAEAYAAYEMAKIFAKLGLWRDNRCEAALDEFKSPNDPNNMLGIIEKAYLEMLRLYSAFEGYGEIILNANLALKILPSSKRILKYQDDACRQRGIDDLPKLVKSYMDPGGAKK